MKIVVVAVGKIRESGLRAAADDYFWRIQRYARFEEREVKADKDLPGAIPKEALVVALEVKGKAHSSEAFARRLDQWTRTHKGVVAFVIGGAEGIPKSVSSTAHELLSLSTMTLPHRLARVLLAEQIYRGFTILRGEPYAREE